MLKPGSFVAGYRIERLLGSGGMGAVYLARHPELPRSDALKILTSTTSGDEQFRRRFLREAEVAATLDHPNIVTIYNRGRADSGEDPDGQLWIAMQYVPGSDCAAELAAIGRGMDPKRVARIISETAKGVDYAHRKGLLHRDIKPANILLSQIDDDATFDEQRVLLTDFGVAKPADEVDSLTVAGIVLATLSYASPEQLDGAALNGRTDQYSLAATAFHMLTGHVPFADRSASAVIRAHLSEPVPRVSAEVAGLSPAVDAVIAKAMAKAPADRFGSCREFADALTMALRTSSSSGTGHPQSSVTPHGRHSGGTSGPVSGPPVHGRSGPHAVPVGVGGQPGHQPVQYGAAHPVAPTHRGPAPPSTGPHGPDTGSSYAGLVAALLALVVIAVIILVLIVSNVS
ncbi:serine/threonine-protein kinase [Gordonia sp. CPCC 205515]|uniref:serine/threonine-protein kinase n=1 Tax=Gordonia sp. CPCC 205515 TaxID=3140791 RepID=UPI003AF3DF49